MKFTIPAILLASTALAQQGPPSTPEWTKCKMAAFEVNGRKVMQTKSAFQRMWNPIANRPNLPRELAENSIIGDYSYTVKYVFSKDGCMKTEKFVGKNGWNGYSRTTITTDNGKIQSSAMAVRPDAEEAYKSKDVSDDDEEAKYEENEVEKGNEDEDDDYVSKHKPKNYGYKPKKHYKNNYYHNRPYHKQNKYHRGNGKYGGHGKKDHGKKHHKKNSYDDDDEDY